MAVGTQQSQWRRHTVAAVAAAASAVLVALATADTPAVHSSSGSVFESTASIVYVRATERSLAEALIPGTGQVTSSTNLADAYARQIQAPEFASAIAAAVGGSLHAADVIQAIDVTTSANGSLIHIRAQQADPGLAESIAATVAGHLVDAQMAARIGWVADYRELLDKIDPRTVLMEPPKPAALLADPLYIAEVSPATAIDAGQPDGVAWRVPGMIAVLIFLAGAGAAFTFEWAKGRVFSADEVEMATGAPRLGFTAATRSDTVATIAVELARQLHSAGKNSLVVTSPGRGDGKSTTVTDLATFFGDSGLNVIVVESDFLGDTTGGRIDRGTHRPGLADLITSDVQIDHDALDRRLEATTARGVRRLPIGINPRSARSLLGSERMNAIVQKLKSHADLILFDSPAVTAVHDAATLANMAGASVLVIREGWTSMTGTWAAVRQLSMTGAPILGFAYVQRPSLLCLARDRARLMGRDLRNVRRVALASAIPALGHIMLTLTRGR